MNILYAKAGKKTNAKFTKNINNKFYSYTGMKEEGFLIEELVFNALSKHKEFKDIKFQVIVETEKFIYFITYNDQSSVQEGEDTIAYSLEEFSKENISEFISNLIIEDIPIVYITYHNNKLIINSDFLNINEEIQDKDISVEKLISRITKIKAFLSSKIIEIILIILIVSIPLLTITPLKNGIIENRNTLIKKLKTEYNVYETEKSKIESKNFMIKKRYDLIKNSKDVLTNHSIDYIWRAE